MYMRAGVNIRTLILTAAIIIVCGCSSNRYAINCKSKFDNIVDNIFDNVSFNNCTLVETNKFKNKFRHKVYSVWIYPYEAAVKCDEGISIISFTILNNGTIANINLDESSGINILDKAALLALRKASPVDKLPACIDNAITINGKFYHVIKPRKQ